MFEYIGFMFVIIVVAAGSRTFQRYDSKYDHSLLMKSFTSVIKEIELATSKVYPHQTRRMMLRLDEVNWSDNVLYGEAQGISYRYDLVSGSIMLTASFHNQMRTISGTVSKDGVSEEFVSEIEDLVRTKHQWKQTHDRYLDECEDL